jgi:hypothetical protein
MKSSRIHIAILLATVVSVTSTAFATPAPPAPDGGSSILLLCLSVAGLSALARKFRR